MQTRSRAGKASQGGFSLVEVAILSVFLLVAIGGLSGAVLSSLRLSRSSEESAIADEAAHALAGALELESFAEIFMRYNGVTGDDPALGVSPGASFDVTGLTPRSTDADGRVGRLVFPSVLLPGGVEILRESVQDARLGMDQPGLAPGRDLNGDGDALDDLGADYMALPVRLIIEWTGVGGDRSYELDLLLVP